MNKENLEIKRIFINIDPKKYEDTQKYFNNKSKKTKQIFERIVDQLEDQRFKLDNISGKYMLFNTDSIFDGISIKSSETRFDILSKCSSSIDHLGYFLDLEKNNTLETFKIRHQPKEQN